MNSGIFDINGVEIKVGDRVKLPYYDPGGNLHIGSGGTVEVVFKYGCFGYNSPTQFSPFFSLLTYERGDYVPNAGNKRNYIEEYHIVVTEDPLDWSMW